MHDKYAYEALEMALHDGDILRTRASGIAGISIVADSLAAIKFGKVRVIRDERGLAVGFEQEGSYVPFGNNDDATDQIAVDITKTFMNYMRQHEGYRDSEPTQSLLTITSNVVYGKNTGATPCGRPAGVPFAPRCQPHERSRYQGCGGFARFCGETPLPALARRYLLHLGYLPRHTR